VEELTFGFTAVTDESVITMSLVHKCSKKSWNGNISHLINDKIIYIRVFSWK